MSSGVIGLVHGRQKTEVVRDRLFTPERCALIVAAVAKPMSQKDAAFLAGITPELLYRWMKRGTSERAVWEKDMESLADDEEDPEPTPHAQFYMMVKWAESNFKSNFLDKAYAALDKNPMTWAFLVTVISRFQPDLLGQSLDKVAVEHSGHVTHGLIIVSDGDNFKDRAGNIARAHQQALPPADDTIDTDFAPLIRECNNIVTNAGEDE